MKIIIIAQKHFNFELQTVCSEELGSLAGDKQLFIPLGFYKGCKVAIKRIHEKNIHLNRAQMLELKKVRMHNLYFSIVRLIELQYTQTSHFR